MKKNLSRIFTVMLVISVLMSMLSVNVYADELAPTVEYICGKTVHVHDEFCKCGETQDLTCGKEEHNHEADACETECTAEYDITCTKGEHIHSEEGGECYTLHVCDDRCKVCLQAEEYTFNCSEEHEHSGADGSCYTLHSCGEGCTYGPCELNGVYLQTCGKEPHTHSVIGGECYDVHNHADECYTCGAAAHAHDEGCYTAHQCKEACYTCGMEEHEHVFDCKKKEPNVWYGDKYAIDVTAGEDEYKFMSVFTEGPYEMSNHAVTGANGHEMPQTLVMIDASKDYTWTPDGVYSFGSSNYEVMYCCDVKTGYKNGIYYKRTNLEDSTYYNEEEAAHIRAIITNSYPFVSLEMMKANLAAEGFADAYKLTRADIITAVQTAVWSFANSNDADDLAYFTTFDVPNNPQWGTVFHDYTNEMEVWWKTGNGQLTANAEVGARIDALTAHLKTKTAVYAESNQVIVTGIEVLNTIPVQEEEGVYNVVIRVSLNNGGSSTKDDIHINISVDGDVVKSEKTQLGTNVYDFVVPVRSGQAVDAVVSGTQILPQGVYFYSPEEGREKSQSLVGVAAGATAVYAAASVTPDLPEVEVKADLNLQKIGSVGQALAGAEFELSVIDDGNAYSVGTFSVNESGKLAVEDLLPGTYQLVETAAPEGFQRLTAPVEFTVSEEGAVVLMSNAGNMASIHDGVLTVRNNPTEVPYYPPYKEEPEVTPPAETPEEPPVIEVEDEETPLGDAEAEVEIEVEVEEPDVPLADIEEIEEEEVPLTDVPKTSDSTNMMLWMMMALLSAAALAGMRIAERRER